MDWNGKPYHSLDYELKTTFGQKVYKLALDGGMTCPNRDGTLGTGGCIFCSEGGSGDFAARVCRLLIGHISIPTPRSAQSFCISARPLMAMPCPILAAPHSTASRIFSAFPHSPA